MLRQFMHFMPTKVIFGESTFDMLPEIVKPMGDSVFVITTRKSLRIAGLLDKLENMLSEADIHYHIYSLEDNHRPFEVINHIASLVKEMKADVLMAIGGGSVMDATKGVAVAAVSRHGIVEDYLGKGKVKMALPIIAVPTTAGSGGEVTHYAQISVNGKWDVIHSSKIVPKVAVVDPTTTLTLDYENTVYSGFEAVAHLIEGYFSCHSNPIIEPLALKGIYLVQKSFVRAAEKGKDIEARSDMSLAALLGGIVINDAGVGLTHFLGFPISEDLDVPHGLINALLLPPVLEKNIARGGPLIHGKVELMKLRLGMDILEFIYNLRDKFNMPHSLVEWGADTRMDINDWTRRAMHRIKAYKTSLPYVPTEEEVREIYLKVLRG
ncbi:iron-containing alcohol dehydrogenase [bacterium 3DAC]|nr:iron-containing alcohol dehydrogenase [Dictyoglomota bacterium]UZN23481.1 iron-containing alcohol dehydrogenase [bacterium 3DAC]